MEIGGKKILRELSFSVSPGIIGLLGPNGAGKSTFIKLILGVMRPTKGEVLLNGKGNYGGEDPLTRVGFMPEARAFHPSMRGVDYVIFAGELQGMPRRDARRRANETLDCLGVGESRFRPMGQYSAGMIQKTKLAQALVHDPPLLILDEPTAGLDPPSREEMLELLRVLGDSHGKSILISTHLLGDVERTCDQVVVLNQGECLFCGKLLELLKPSKSLFQISFAGEMENPQEIFQSAGWEFTLGEEPGLGVVAGPPGESPTHLFQSIHRARGWVKKLVPVEPRLDEVFFTLIQNHRGGK